MLTDLLHLLRGDSKWGLVWFALWTLSFIGLAVGSFVTGSHWLALGWGVGALLGLIGLGVAISRRQAAPQDQGSSVGPLS